MNEVIRTTIERGGELTRAWLRLWGMQDNGTVAGVEGSVEPSTG
jgi:hypothetical protein